MSWQWLGSYKPKTQAQACHIGNPPWSRLVSPTMVMSTLIVLARELLRIVMNEQLISGRRFAELIGLKYPGQFNAARSALQKTWDRKTGELRDYPHTLFDAAGCTKKETRERRRARKEFDRSNILVVPEWGGIKWPGTEWRYDRRKGEALAQQGVDALSGIGESWP